MCVPQAWEGRKCRAQHSMQNQPKGSPWWQEETASRCGLGKLLHAHLWQRYTASSVVLGPRIVVGAGPQRGPVAIARRTNYLGRLGPFLGP